MSEFLSKIFKSSLISSIGLSILGILLFFESEATIVSISYIIGGILITMGILGIIKYFFSEINSIIDIIYGIITIILGVVVIVNPHGIASIIPFVIGIIIVISSVTKLQYALRLNKNRNPVWKSTMILSIITLAFGILLIINPFSGALFLTKIVGFIVLLYGILDIISTLTIRKTFKKLHNAIEETIQEAEVIREESSNNPQIKR